ncbi:MAG: BON domain-containing protein [Thiohalocapsa sp.]|nr:BON domain-containing protein [Thiohalocapsa sp.]
MSHDPRLFGLSAPVGATLAACLLAASPVLIGPGWPGSASALAQPVAQPPAQAVAEAEAPAAQARLGDREIADAIEDQLLIDGVVDVNRIDIEVEDGIASLTGQVGNLLAKDRAERVAGRVKGVRAVGNRIEVTPSVMVSDAGIKRSVEEALRADPAADAYEIDVAVQNNVVTLSGRVQSWAELDLVDTVARSVRGVIGVVNDIEVSTPDERLDNEIRDEIAQRLRWAVSVEDGLIDVAVDDGVVTLTGAVGSLEEKRAAESLALVSGVDAVDVTGLEVRWWAERAMLRDGKYVDKSDAEIRRALLDAAALDPRVMAFELEPEVAGGWVTLRGTVDNLEAKRAVAGLASNTVGVTGVTNRVKVRPETARSDAAIEVDIESRLAVSPMTDAEQIEVAVDEGAARLSGSVDSQLERREAERLAAKARGVTRVTNLLQVAHANGLREPFDTSGYPSMTEILRYPPAGRSDREIHDEIHDELFWSPFVDSDDIDIDVTDGRAMLTGSVATWREYRAAEENAYEGGALFVSNQLKVE